MDFIPWASYKRDFLEGLNEPGVGVAKQISSVPLFSQFFIFVKAHFNC